MNKSWIRHDHVSAISATAEIIHQHQTPITQYRLVLHLLGGQTMNYIFDTEEEQIRAYEVYKPKD